MIRYRMLLVAQSALDKAREMNQRLNNAYKNDDSFGKARDAVVELGNGVTGVIRAVVIITVEIALIIAAVKYATSSSRDAASEKARIGRVLIAVVGICIATALLILVDYIAVTMASGV